MQKLPQPVKAAWLGLGLCGLAASSVAAVRTGPGYLAALGPAPIRFQPTFVHVVAAPSPAQAQNPLAPTTNSTAAQEAPKPEQPLDSTKASPEPWLSPNFIGPDLPAVARQPDSAALGALSPQSIIGLLRPVPTNSVPDQFVPPAFVPPPPPLPPRSSTATYEVR